MISLIISLKFDTTDPFTSRPHYAFWSGVAFRLNTRGLCLTSAAVKCWGMLTVLCVLFVCVQEDEVKLNNVFYKLGRHDTNIEGVDTSVHRLADDSRRIEAKLNKHAFNVSTYCATHHKTTRERDRERQGGE